MQITMRIFLVMLMMPMATSCHRSTYDDQPIQIIAVQKLNAKIGDTVNWTFEARRGKRTIPIVNINAGLLPFGVRVEPQGFAVGGKVLGSEMRTGRIRVTAFDKEGCLREFENTKRLAIKNIQDSGTKDIVLPMAPCDITSGVRPKESLAHFGDGDFAWNLNQPEDQIDPKTVAQLISKITNSKQIPRKQPQRPVLFIPNREAPHTTHVVVGGSCITRDFKHCGPQNECIWADDVCVSKSTTLREIKSGDGT